MRLPGTFLLFLFVFSFLLCGAPAVSAAEFSVTPVLIDEKAQARDILKKSLVLRNESGRKLTLYPSVRNVLPEEGDVEFKEARNADDRKASLANWIEISRGVIDLAPGEEREISFIIRVNMNAEPGIYHANISFANGSTRAGAESRDDAAGVTVNLEIADDAKEELQLLSFITDRIFFSGDDVLFSYNLENIGNREVLPTGEIRIYNRRGEEIATVEANKDGRKIQSDETSRLASVWNAASGFGKYKAFLNLNYGKTQRGSVQDTVFFWVVPWKVLAGVLGGGLLLMFIIATIFHRWLTEHHGKIHLSAARADLPAGADPVSRLTDAELHRTGPEQKNGDGGSPPRIKPNRRLFSSSILEKVKKGIDRAASYERRIRPDESGPARRSSAEASAQAERRRESGVVDLRGFGAHGDDFPDAGGYIVDLRK